MVTIEDREYMRLRDKIQRGDLDVKNSAGVILHAPFGALIMFRDELEKKFGKGLIYFTISGQPLYVVHLNDLSREKQESLRRRRDEKISWGKHKTK